VKLKREFLRNEKSFVFVLINGTYSIAINFKDKKLTYYAAKWLSKKMFEGQLSEEEIVELFGEVPIPKGWEPHPNEDRWITTNRLDKEKIKELTRRIKRWWIKGIEKCKFAVKEKFTSTDWLKDEYIVWKINSSSSSTSN
jgi:hypothetical protein